MLYNWTAPIFKTFVQARHAGRLPQALCIAGDEALGSYELALECARFYLCQKPLEQGVCGECADCRCFGEDLNPDLLLLLGCSAADCEKGADFSHSPSDLRPAELGERSYPVRIDSVRKMGHWLSEAPQVGHSKVVIISQAHAMQEGAANALLKTFEEPPAYALIILVTRSFEALLPTLLSRAFKLQIPPCSLENALSYLKVNRQDELALHKAALALALAGGAPLRAKEYLLSGTCDLVENLVNKFAEACATQQYEQVCYALAKLTEAEQLLVLRELVLELLKYKAGVEIAALPMLTEVRGQALGRMKAEALFEVQELLTEYQRSYTLTQRAPLATLYTLVERFYRGYPVGNR
ncbi:MAG: hypothetical protein K6F05_08845 [Succinivibrio sp.]|nr:hypothetical protein [Succinivibrio sp.]